MNVRAAGLVVAWAALAALAWIPGARCGETPSPANTEQQAREAADTFSRAEATGAADADSRLETAIGLWEKAVEGHPDSAECHEQIAYLLSRKIGRAWQRGVIPGSADLKPVWARVAFHRRRVLELTAGRPSSPMSVMEVAYSYEQAGDLRQAERYYERIGDPLVMFRFYAQQRAMDKAERVFNSLSGFEARYEAATYALGCAADEGALRLGELMLHDGYDAHQRAAVYRLLAQANARLRRKERLLDCATKAVALNPNSPWGWWWLAEAYHLGGYAEGEAWYASQAAVLKHELAFFTGDSENDRMSRGQIYSRLGYLYRMPFRQPEIAVAYYRKAIDEFTGLPQDWYRCEGLYMNIISTCVHNLHDMQRAQEVVQEAQRAFPGFPYHDEACADLLKLGLPLDSASKKGDPAARSQSAGQDK